MSRPEEWREVPSLPGYCASSDGRVAGPRGVRATHVETQPNGFRREKVTIDGRSRYVHHLVLEAFVGPRPSGWVARHLDGDGTNNRPENLSWGTNSENQMDRVEHGTSNRGSAHGMARLTEDDVRGIRALSALGWTQRALGERYGIRQQHVSEIVRGVCWGWLDAPGLG